jgi:protein-disulfide isomerase
MKRDRSSAIKMIAVCALASTAIFTAVIAGANLKASPQPGQNTATVRKASAHPVAPAVSAPVKTYGTKSAPITVEAFTDYQCPGCRALYQQALRPMINEYVASGKVYLIHHDFPLVMHQYSGQAARWANASAMVGDFGPVESALFDNQPAWETDGNIAKYVAKAMPLADFQRVQAIMRNCTTPAPQATTPDADPLAKSGHACPVDPYIASDMKLGYHVPVNFTPTYVIYYKGQKIAASSDIVSWPILKQFFDSLLNQ